MEQAKQQKTVSLDRGLFLIRYATAEDEIQPPMVTISPDPPSNKDISFLLAPRSQRGCALAAGNLFSGAGLGAGKARGPGCPVARRRLGRRNGQNRTTQPRCGGADLARAKDAQAARRATPGNCEFSATSAESATSPLVPMNGSPVPQRRYELREFPWTGQTSLRISKSATRSKRPNHIPFQVERWSSAPLPEPGATQCQSSQSCCRLTVARRPISNLTSRLFFSERRPHASSASASLYRGRPAGNLLSACG